MDPHSSPAVEQWFLRRGLPHFIDDYGAREDILTRMVPFVGIVFTAEVILAVFGDRFAGWQQAAVAGLALVLIGVSVFIANRIRHDRTWHLPRRVGSVEVAVFALVPAAVAAVFGSHRAVEVPLLFFGNLALLLVVYPVTSYGLVPMTRWAAGQLRHQVRGMSQLMIRTLPLLLVFSAFLFLNAEVWQVANDLAWPFFGAVLLGIMLLGSLFLALSTRTDVVNLAQFSSWDEVCELCDGSPLEGVTPAGFTGHPEPPPLSARARFNVALVIFASQSIQVLLVAVVTFAVYVSFGLVTVREETIGQWIADGELPDADRIGDLTLFGHELVLSRQLFVVAGFIAGFATLQFLVQLVTDDRYRDQFVRSMARETRQVLAVRTAYLARS